jgi:hypothetical protein
MTSIINQNQLREDTDLLDGNEFVFTQIQNPDGTKSFVGGGFKVNSFFLQDNVPVMATLNESKQTGGKVSSPFENLAVPAGLFYINQKIPKNELPSNPTFESKKMLPDDIMDKLFGLVEIDKKQKRKTRKHIPKLDKKKSRKHLHLHK